MARTKPREEKFSDRAIRQQQQAWILYMAEGHLAALEAAKARNSFKMFSEEIVLLDEMIENQAAIVSTIRTNFFGE